jgi:hypothetical protein
MGEVSIRFGVGDGTAKRAATWKCWAIIGAGKNDVYLANRHLAGALKASMHASGEWHIGFDRRYLEEHARPEEWPSRFVDQSKKPFDLLPGYTLACRIVTPSASVNVLPRAETSRTITWVAPPPDGQAVEVGVVLTAPHVRYHSWPGHRSMNTALVGRFQLDNGGTVWLVSRVVDFPTGRFHFNRDRYFSGRTPADVAGPDVRAILVGADANGSWVMYDVVVGEGPGTVTVSSHPKS